MTWNIEVTDQFRDWYDNLDVVDSDAVTEAVNLLERQGPTLKRPLVGEVQSSQHKNMKELRVMVKEIRILFAFDPRRTGLLLIGGDKTGDWDRWYEGAIPVADALYDAHLREIAPEKKGRKKA